MKEPYLEVTFRHGRPIAAYYYVPRQKVSLAALNAVLRELGQAPASEADLAPVLAA